MAGLFPSPFKASTFHGDPPVLSVLSGGHWVDHVGSMSPDFLALGGPVVRGPRQVFLSLAHDPIFDAKAYGFLGGAPPFR